MFWKKQGIHVALRKNHAGMIYGITYVDHQTKCVFNGSALGKPYSAKAIQERCQQEVLFEQQIALKQIGKQPFFQQDSTRKKIPLAVSAGNINAEQIINMPDVGKVLDKLMQPEQPSEFLPSQLNRNKKKKRRKKWIPNNQ